MTPLMFCEMDVDGENTRNNSERMTIKYCCDVGEDTNIGGVVEPACINGELIFKRRKNMRTNVR